MRKSLVRSIFVCILLTALSCGYVLAQQNQQQAIPSSFFGMHVNNPQVNNESSYPLQVTYGEFRNWDVSKVSWPEIETCQAASGNPSDPCFTNWTTLDTELLNLHSPGINNVMFTLSRTPGWAVTTTQQMDTTCAYYSSSNTELDGACYPPIDLQNVNGDGSGTDLIWRNWVTAVATHTNNLDSSHAHVKYWEIWNEFNRNNPAQGSVSWYGTPNQLIRLAEDAHCIIKGTGTIHNYPSFGQSTACSATGWTTGIDPNAQIVQPSITGQGSIDPAKCFLYCDATACGNFYGSGYECTVAPRAGADAIDIVNFHFYGRTQNPEQFLSTQVPVSALRNALVSTEKSKPLWVGEGSWGDSLATDNMGHFTSWWRDPYLQGGFVARYFAAIWSNTEPLSSNTCIWSSTNLCQQAFWYGYDYDLTIPNTGYKAAIIGALYCPGAVTHGTCDNGPNHGAGLIQPQAGMWNMAVSWLTNAIPATTPFCQLASGSNTVWHCDFTKGGVGQLGTLYSIVWDNKPDVISGVNAHVTLDYCHANFPNPYICGNTSYQYTVPSGDTGKATDLNGQPVITGGGGTITVPIGLNPVLITNVPNQ